MSLPFRVPTNSSNIQIRLQAENAAEKINNMFVKAVWLQQFMWVVKSGGPVLKDLEGNRSFIVCISALKGIRL